ncbi:MAG: hypothetical protein GY696_21110, partial [Gammaproteobacteria bacterium]|nr:hypothetical protein [Gammaproteobacteria bacterium]
MTPAAEAIEMHQSGGFFTESAGETWPEPPTETLRVSKSEAEWIRTLLQAKQAKNQEFQREKEALQAREQSAMVLGGQQRSADHPHRVDTGYRTMSAWQLEDRAARWGHISLEQLEARMDARKQPGIALYPGTDPGSTEQRDLFRSYKQGMNQAVTHYLKVKWSLFEQGWPDPTRRSIAFGIEDIVQGIYNRAVTCSLDKECVRTFQDLLDRAVVQVWRERRAMHDGKSCNQSWHGLDLQERHQTRRTSCQHRRIRL